MKLNQLGFDHATTNKSPDTSLIYDIDYALGYHEGLKSKLEWAKQDLECFEAEYLMDLAE
jgi:hypothetical protein